MSSGRTTQFCLQSHGCTYQRDLGHHATLLCASSRPGSSILSGPTPDHSASGDSRSLVPLTRCRRSHPSRSRRAVGTRFLGSGDHSAPTTGHICRPRPVLRLLQTFRTNGRFSSSEGPECGQVRKRTRPSRTMLRGSNTFSARSPENTDGIISPVCNRRLEMLFIDSQGLHQGLVRGPSAGAPQEHLAWTILMQQSFPSVQKM